MGTDCKSASYAFRGSNHILPIFLTISDLREIEGRFLFGQIWLRCTFQVLKSPFWLSFAPCEFFAVSENRASFRRFHILTMLAGSEIMGDKATNQKAECSNPSGACNTLSGRCRNTEGKAKSRLCIFCLSGWCRFED